MLRSTGVIAPDAFWDLGMLAGLGDCAGGVEGAAALTPLASAARAEPQDPDLLAARVAHVLGAAGFDGTGGVSGTTVVGAGAAGVGGASTGFSTVVGTGDSKATTGA